MEERIKVTDKRMFTADGEIREDFRDRGTGADASGDLPASGPVEERSTAEPRAAEPAAPNLATAEPPTEPARTGQSERGDGPPLPTFMDLIGLLAQPIALFLGDASMPDGEAEENLPLARFHIDLLELVQTKTRGNISSEEAKLLEGLLYQMRMRYVEKVG